MVVKTVNSLFQISDYNFFLTQMKTFRGFGMRFMRIIFPHHLNPVRVNVKERPSNKNNETNEFVIWIYWTVAF